MSINALKHACIPLLLAHCIFHSGCTGVNRLETSAPYYVSSKADTRGAVVMPPGTVTNGIVLSHRLCIEPSPDVIKELLVDTHAKVNAKSSVEIDALAKVQTTAVQLAERTQGVVYLRECLYRLCELSNNGSIEPKGVSELYQLCLNNARILTQTQIENPETVKLLSIERIRIEQEKTARAELETAGLKEIAKTAASNEATEKLKNNKQNTELQEQARKAKQAARDAEAARVDAETKLAAAEKATKEASDKLAQQQLADKLAKLTDAERTAREAEEKRIAEEKAKKEAADKRADGPASAPVSPNELPLKQQQ